DQADGVDLADGRHFPADLVILSTGVRPVTGPARRAGLVCDRGVVTSPQLLTSDPDILAAGDCIQCGGPNPGLWNYARISGEIAGYNVVHPEDPKTFEAGTFPLIMSAMNMGLFAAGITAESEEVTAEVRCWENAEQPDQFRVNEKALGSAQRGSRGSVQGTALGTAPGGFLRAETYEKRFYRDNRLCGAVLIGDISGMAEILDELEAIRGKYKAEEYNP
ncbi:MAG: FAD-dependent oxidoreductase, partial [Oscillospiraceae bacterium]|nr:FAD-dependent oxidoreductase [Oscillospiraceae bacterium]